MTKKTEEPATLAIVLRGLRELVDVVGTSPVGTYDETRAGHREILRKVVKLIRVVEAATPKSAPDTALKAIQARLDGAEWDSATMSDVASIVIDAGYAIRDPADMVEDTDGD